MASVLQAISFFRDYQEIPHLDTYNIEELDEDEYDALNPEDRAQIDSVLNARDRENAIMDGKIPRAFLQG